MDRDKNPMGSACMFTLRNVALCALWLVVGMQGANAQGKKGCANLPNEYVGVTLINLREATEHQSTASSRWRVFSARECLKLDQLPALRNGTYTAFVGWMPHGAAAVIARGAQKQNNPPFAQDLWLYDARTTYVSIASQDLCVHTEPNGISYRVCADVAFWPKDSLTFGSYDPSRGERGYMDFYSVALTSTDAPTPVSLPESNIHDFDIDASSQYLALRPLSDEHIHIYRINHNSIDGLRRCDIDVAGAGATWSPDGQWLLFLGADFYPYVVRTNDISRAFDEAACRLHAQRVSKVHPADPNEELKDGHEFRSATVQWAPNSSEDILYWAKDIGGIQQIVRVRPADKKPCETVEDCMLTTGGNPRRTCDGRSTGRSGNKFYPTESNDGKWLVFVEDRFDDKCKLHEDLKAVDLQDRNVEVVLSDLGEDIGFATTSHWHKIN